MTKIIDPLGEGVPIYPPPVFFYQLLPILGVIWGALRASNMGIPSERPQEALHGVLALGREIIPPHRLSLHQREIRLFLAPLGASERVVYPSPYPRPLGLSCAASDPLALAQFPTDPIGIRPTKSILEW